MSRANSLVVPGGQMELAMQLIFTPMIWRLVETAQAPRVVWAVARLELQRLASVVAAIAVAGTIWAARSPWCCREVQLSVVLGRAGPAALAENAEQMQANNAVIDYSLYPWVDELVIPHLPMSA